MVEASIYIRGQKYFLYDSYSNRRRAVQIANWARKKYGSKYFILVGESGFTAQKVYRLYLTKLRRLWS